MTNKENKSTDQEELSPTETLNQIEVLTDELKSQKKDFTKKLAALSAQVSACSDREAKAKAALVSIEALLNRKTINAARIRAKELSDLYQTCLLKNLVFTETLHATNDDKKRASLVLALMVAQDQSDEWWSSKKGITIGEWREELLSLNY